jgi:hypothetical protein
MMEISHSRQILPPAQPIALSRVSSPMAHEPDETNPANPRNPAGGMAMLLLAVLVILIAAFLAWALLGRSASAPTPTATANPPVAR